MSMLYMAIGGAIIGGVSSILSADAQAEQMRQQIEANRKGAKFKYTAVEDSVNIMKGATREASMNAVQEALRAGAAQDTKVQEAITKTASTTLAQSEGLTSGRSKGREMLTLYIKGNKALQETKSITTSMVNQITEANDAKTNELNNSLLNAHQEMSAVLTAASPYVNATGQIVAGTLGGAAAGASLGSAFGGGAKTAPPK